jgi:hypothetical protein
MFCSNCNYFLPWTESTPAESAQKTDMPRRPQNETPPPEIAQPAQRAKSAPPSTAGNRSGRPAPGARADTAPPAPRSSVPDIMAAIDAGREIASRGGRSDLEQHLGQARERLSARTIPVVVAGEFKQGKSSMINALLQREVCPVDADVVTAVPTTVRYADKPQVSRYVLSDDGQRVDEETMPFDSLPRLVTERANPDDVGLQLMIEVGLPHRMLRSGLALVDTPGVGGLQSADGHLTLGALGQAEGVLFVSAAAQELTGPELAFLRTAAERCPRIALVMPKIDLYPHWRRIVEINRGHLARASLPIPIIPISSLLRFRAGSDPELSAESRFADLVAFLARDIVAATRDNVARSAAVEVEFVAAQLQQQAHAERAVIAAPERAAEVVAELDTAQRQASKLAAPTATWQVTLGDGIAKLESDIDFDLQQRFREILHEAEAAIDEYDPKDVWTDLDAWLRRELAVATVTNRDLLVNDIKALFRRDRNAVYFLIASALYRDGLAAIFAFGAILAVSVYGMAQSTVLIFGIAANIVAALGALSMGAVEDRIGPKRVIMISLIGLITTSIILLFAQGTTMFWVFGLILTLWVGPAQSSSRAFMARLAPVGREGEMFGLYATTGRAASFLAPGLFALFSGLFSDRVGIVGIALVLLAGAVLLARVKSPPRQQVQVSE